MVFLSPFSLKAQYNLGIATVTVNPLPTVMVNSPTICAGQSTTLTANGGTSYNWSAGATTSGSNTATASPANTTTYTVTGSSLGCLNTAISSVTVNPLPSVTASATVSAVCTGGSTILTGGGTTSYSWSNSVANGVAFNPATTNTYTVTGTDGNGCVNTATQLITVNPLPTVTVNSLTICPGLTATLTANGANTYSWSAGATSTGLNTADVTPSSTTTYTVTGTSNGCSSTAVATVTIGSSLSINVNSPSICTGQTANLTATGAASYTWSAGATSTGTNTATASPASTTSYTVTGTNGSCTGTGVALVTVNPFPTLLITNPAAVCAPNTVDISAPAVTAGSSSGSISYWQDAAATVTLNNTYYTVIDTTGAYYIELSNAGCSTIATVTTTVNHNCVVWPGDADNDSIVNNFDLLPVGLFYSQAGPPRTATSNAWLAYLSTNWGTSETNGSDIKHADCNGDGIIDNNDTLAINLNFNLTHAITTHPVISYAEKINTPALYFVTSSNTYNAGSFIDVEVWAGSAVLPVSNLYGLAFNIDYDAYLVQSGTESLTYPVSWLGTPGTNAITIAKIDALATIAYGAETRINHTNSTGFGKIADFKFQAKTNITTTSILHLSVSNYKANDSAGVAEQFNTINDSIIINPLGVGVQVANNKNDITIYPNPFTSQTTISFSETQKNTTIKIMDVVGKEIKTVLFSGKSLILEKGEMQSGVYLLQITDENKNVVNRKVVVE